MSLLAYVSVLGLLCLKTSRRQNGSVSVSPIVLIIVIV